MPDFHRLPVRDRCPPAYGHERGGVKRYEEAHLPTRLTLLCCAATPSSRSGAFPHPDEPLDRAGREKAGRRAAAHVPGIMTRSPARAALETAAAMGIDASVEDRLADMGFGPWAGRSFADVHGSDAAALARWMAAPQEGAPGGETLGEVRRRIRPWLDAVAGRDGATLAITHAMVVRAALAEALDLPDRSVARIDVAPLSEALLSFNRGWRLRELRAG